MILDISSYNGVIEWNTVIKKNQIDRVILRATTKNGKLDTRFLANYKALKALKVPIDIYKFSYATDAQSAFSECDNVIFEMERNKIEFDKLWLDIENDGALRWTKKRAFDVICGYMACLRLDYTALGIYCNLDYYKSVIPEPFKTKLPLWVARWTSGKLGIYEPNIKYWQYTSKGEIDGINGNVDISSEV